MPVPPAPAPLCHNALCSVLTLATSRRALLRQYYQVSDVNSEIILTYSFERAVFFCAKLNVGVFVFLRLQLLQQHD